MIPLNQNGSMLQTVLHMKKCHMKVRKAINYRHCRDNLKLLKKLKDAVNHEEKKINSVNLR